MSLSLGLDDWFDRLKEEIFILETEKKILLKRIGKEQTEKKNVRKSRFPKQVIYSWLDEYHLRELSRRFLVCFF